VHKCGESILFGRKNRLPARKTILDKDWSYYRLRTKCIDSHLILGAARELNGFEFVGSAGAGEDMIGRRFAPAVAMTLNMGVAFFPVFSRFFGFCSIRVACDYDIDIIVESSKSLLKSRCFDF